MVFLCELDRPTMRYRCTRREPRSAGRKHAAGAVGAGDMEDAVTAENLEAAQSPMRTAPAVIKTHPNHLPGQPSPRNSTRK